MNNASINGFMTQTADDLLSTRATLLERLKDWQDHASWQDFFETYWRLIYSVARKSGLTETEAQDVVQDTMIAVARQMPGFEYSHDGSFRTWLCNLTRWRIADQLRKRQQALDPHPSDEDAEKQLAEQVPDPKSEDLNLVWETEWKETVAEVATANVKRRMDPQKYQIFDLYVTKQWPAEKVAEAFGISVSQVYLAKHRVTELLRDEVERLKDAFK